VLSVCNWRNPDGTFEVEIGEEIPWIAHADPQFEIGRNTAGYVQVLEEAIRRHPEQWLWTHRRFKGDLSLGTEGEWEQGRPRTQLDSSSEIS
jgi:KDO2-lipid IV(A) lauroyltransferase